MYIPKKEGGRGLANIQDSLNTDEQSPSRYIDSSEEEPLKANKEENILTEWNGETDTQHKHRLRQDHKDKWMTKPLHGQSLRQTREVADSKSWLWLASGNLKKETEGFLMAAQDQALRTNVIKVKIEKRRQREMQGKDSCALG